MHDDGVHYEYLVLDGAQAGLSWETILRKRDAYRRAFAGFDPVKVARFGARDVRRLLDDAGIVRNRMKIESAIGNARAFLAVQGEFGSFDALVWRFVDCRTKVNRPRTLADIAATSRESDALTRELRARGFSFVGPTICYAYLQAAGLIDDHLVACFRKRELASERDRVGGPVARPSSHTTGHAGPHPAVRLKHSGSPRNVPRC